MFFYNSSSRLFAKPCKGENLMPSKLQRHEWLIVSILITTLILLTGMAFFSKKRVLPIPRTEHLLTTELVDVTVQGAAEHIGIFELRKGARIKDLWKLCKPTFDADLSSFKPNQLLRDGQVIKIPLKEYLTVYIRGAVQQEVVLRVLKGTQLKDLKDMIVLQKDADIKILNAKRRLKDQEVIHIRSKKISKNAQKILDKKIEPKVE